jgi:hypothetical protein
LSCERGTCGDGAADGPIAAAAAAAAWAGAADAEAFAGQRSQRLETTGSARQGCWYKAQGCFAQIIRYMTRLFLSLDKPETILVLIATSDDMNAADCAFSTR